jgi:hypothetical protein
MTPGNEPLSNVFFDDGLELSMGERLIVEDSAISFLPYVPGRVNYPLRYLGSSLRPPRLVMLSHQVLKRL